MPHVGITIADFVGSTAGIMKFVEKSKNKSFVIATEQGVTDRLTRDYPNKKIIPIKSNLICPNMKMTSLEDILYVLETEDNEIFVKDDIAKKAVNCLNRMLEVSK